MIADDRIKATAYNTSQEKIDAQVKAGTLYRADTIEELAVQIGIGSTGFSRYNQKVQFLCGCGI